MGRQHSTPCLVQLKPASGCQCSECKDIGGTKKHLNFFKKPFLTFLMFFSFHNISYSNVNFKHVRFWLFGLDSSLSS